MNSTQDFIIEPVANTYVKDNEGRTVFKVVVYCRSTLATKPLGLGNRPFAMGSWLIETDTNKVYILDPVDGWREFE